MGATETRALDGSGLALRAGCPHLLCLRLLGVEALLHFGHCPCFLLENGEQGAEMPDSGLHIADALRERNFLAHGD